MNSMSQQGGFQNQQFGQQQFAGSNQGNQYQPIGYVQSHYQGLPKQQQSGLNAQTAGPVISHTGYSTNQQQQQQQHYGMSAGQSFANQQGSNQQNWGAQQQQPVISHAGYSQNQSYQPTHAASSFGSFTQQAGQGNAGGQHNSYATHTYTTQQQPVISHAGGFSGQAQNQSQWGQQANQAFGTGMQSTNQFGAATQAQTSFNPVYQATNANTGPVLSRLGFSGNAQTGAFQSQAGTSGFGMNQR